MATQITRIQHIRSLCIGHVKGLVYQQEVKCICTIWLWMLHHVPMDGSDMLMQAVPSISTWKDRCRVCWWSFRTCIVKQAFRNFMYVLLWLVLHFYLSVNDKDVSVVNASCIHVTFLTGFSRNKILKWRHEVVSYHVHCELLTVRLNKQ
jgi:hypothetical protein